MTARTSSLTGMRLELPPLAPGRPGDPGLFGPGSMVWRVARERALLVAGPAALLLQIAHPLVAAAVAAHSGFRQDPTKRLRATLDATLRVTFGDAEQAAAAAERVRAVHQRVRGRIPTPVGSFAAETPYDATDPDLALWVYATLITTSVAAFERFVDPMSPLDRERHYREARPFARAFGVPDGKLPPDRAAFDDYVRAMVQGPDLVVGADASGLARGILSPPLPRAARPATGMLKAVTSFFLPPRLRAEFELSWSGWDRAMAATVVRSVRTAVRFAPRSLRYWPHYQVALRRMGNERGQ
jgi:uncharacterized protein (DUF2236 family)